jgi:hypothetical protein
MQLVRTSDGSVVFTDATALPRYGQQGFLTQYPLFDPTSSTLFYTAADGVKELVIASKTVTSLAGTSGMTVMGVAPNGDAVLCFRTEEDGGFAFYLVATGATASTFAVPVTSGDTFGFLADSTFIWISGSTLFAQPVPGGPTVTTSLPRDLQFIGGSQIVTTASPGSSAYVVDMEGKLPNFELSPTPEGTVATRPRGGLVAYSSAGSIYAVKTN